MIRLAIAQAIIGHSGAVSIRARSGKFVETPDLEWQGRLILIAFALALLIGAGLAIGL